MAARRANLSRLLQILSEQSHPFEVVLCDYEERRMVHLDETVERCARILDKTSKWDFYPFCEGLVVRSAYFSSGDGAGYDIVYFQRQFSRPLETDDADFFKRLPRTVIIARPWMDMAARIRIELYEMEQRAVCCNLM